MNLKEDPERCFCFWFWFWWGWVGEGFWRREVSISWTRGGAGSSRTRMGSSLSHSYSMSGMGFPLSLQLVLLRSKSWVKTLVVVQPLSCVWLFVTPWTGACQAALSFTISWSLLKFMSTESVMPSNHLILCHLFLLLSQHQGLFQQVSSSHQMAKVLEFHHKHQSFQWIFTVDFL